MIEASGGGNAAAIVGGIVVLAVLLALWWVPVIVAVRRGHRNVASIVVLTACGLLGLGLPWVAALAWAFSTDVNPPGD